MGRFAVESVHGRPLGATIDRMTRTLRLDPARPPLWRDGSTLQLGTDGAVRLHRPSRWQQRLLADLEAGVDEDDVSRLAGAYGADPDDARTFLAELAPAFAHHTVPTTVVAGVRVVDDAVDHHELGVLFDAMELSGVAVQPEGDVLLAVAAHVLTPRSTAAWMSADVRHLPFVLHADRITIGPLVVPGQTACAACLADHERRRDPAWPVLMAQLLARPRARPPLAVLFEAARLAAAMLLHEDAAGEASRSVTVGRELRRSWRSHRPSEGCGCQSPGGNGSAS